MYLRVSESETSQCVVQAMNATHQSVAESKRNENENALCVAVPIANKKTAAANFGIVPNPNAN